MSQSRQVLVVDDVYMNFMLLKEILEISEHEVYHAYNGLEAISMLQTTKFDIIFMDINMPIMNGIDASIKIKSMNKKPIPIIACTASSLNICDINAIDDVIQKPICFNELSHVMEKYTA
jgi:CheY-like chemotaxis protein